MVIIELTYIQPLAAVEAYLDAHREFLSHYYDQDVFLLSGPKLPREGGVILAKATKQEALVLIQSDPFYQHALAEYQLTEFIPNRAGSEALVGLSD